MSERAQSIPGGGREYRGEDQEDQESDAPQFFLALLKLRQARLYSSLGVNRRGRVGQILIFVFAVRHDLADTPVSLG